MRDRTFRVCYFCSSHFYRYLLEKASCWSKDSSTAEPSLRTGAFKGVCAHLLRVSVIDLFIFHLLVLFMMRFISSQKKNTSKPWIILILMNQNTNKLLIASIGSWNRGKSWLNFISFIAIFRLNGSLKDMSKSMAEIREKIASKQAYLDSMGGNLRSILEVCCLCHDNLKIFSRQLSRWIPIWV